MWKTLKQVLKDINTGIDGESYSNIKIFTNIAVSVMLAGGMVEICRADARDLVNFRWAEFAGGIAAILFSGGGAEAVKQHYRTEPPAEPPTMKTDNKEG